MSLWDVQDIFVFFRFVHAVIVRCVLLPFLTLINSYDPATDFHHLIDNCSHDMNPLSSIINYCYYREVVNKLVTNQEVVPLV